ncbi:TPA: hypothetical protein ACHJ1O_005587, partial [Escherichia coli]
FLNIKCELFSTKSELLMIFPCDCFPFPDTAARGVIKVRNFQQYGVLLFTAVMHQPVLAIVVITV